jgi:arylsulfatase A-like enzyme
MISVDDLNNWVSFLNNFNNVKTPNLDKLAKKSFVFKNAHAPATLCNPSRTAILTGKLPSHTGIYNNEQSAKDLIIKDKLPTIFNHFRSQGYYVISAGKLCHANNDIDTDYDDFFRPKRRISDDTWIKPKIIDKTSNFKMIDSAVADWIVNKINQKYPKPFFMSVGFFFPHQPWVLPKKYFDYYPIEKISISETISNDYDDIPKIARENIQKFIDLNTQIKNQNKMKETIQGYLAAVSYMDEQLGKILDALENSSHAENTIVIFWSDHGYHFGEKDTLGKRTLWDPATNVPFLISMPNKHGCILDTVSLVDIFPTINELCHLKTINELDGTSLVNLMQNKDYKRKIEVISFQDLGSYAIRKNNFKYIHYKDESEEFYDIDQDPHEFYNLASDKNHIIQKNNLKQMAKLAQDY